MVTFSTEGSGSTFEEAIASALRNRKAAGFTDREVAILRHSVRWVIADGIARLWHTVDTGSR